MLGVDPDGQHRRSHRRQVRSERAVQSRELRDHEGDEKRHHHRQHRHQQRGINQRGDQFLTETHRQTLKRNVAAQDFLEVAALLAGQQRGGINLRENFLRLERVRQ